MATKKKALKLRSKNHPTVVNRSRLIPKFQIPDFINEKFEEWEKKGRSAGRAKQKVEGLKKELKEKKDPIQNQLNGILNPLNSSLDDAKERVGQYEDEKEQIEANVKKARTGQITIKRPDYYKKRKARVKELNRLLGEDKANIKDLEKKLKSKEIANLQQQIKELEGTYGPLILDVEKKYRAKDEVALKIFRELDVYFITFKCMVIENRDYFWPLIEAICAANRGKESVWIYITFSYCDGKAEILTHYDSDMSKVFDSKYTVPAKWLKEPLAAGFNYEASFTANIHKKGGKRSYHLKQDYNVDVRVEGIPISRKVFEQNAKDWVGN